MGRKESLVPHLLFRRTPPGTCSLAFTERHGVQCSAYIACHICPVLHVLKEGL